MKENKFGIDVEKKYTVSVDYENNAEEWWDNGGRELWIAFAAPVGNWSNVGWRCEKTASGKDVAAFLEAAKKISGWAAGPYYAKYPVFVTEVD